MLTLTASVWITSSGRQASMTNMLVCGWTAKPVARPAMSKAMTMPGSTSGVAVN